MNKLNIKLARQIFFALILGILSGSILHSQSDLCRWVVTNILLPTGNIFIHMIKMIVVPIVIATLVTGVSSIGDAKKFGSIGFKTILYFEIVTTLAIVLGIVLANVFHPGYGIDISTLAVSDILQYQSTAVARSSDAHSPIKAIASFVPENIFSSMAKGDMLPIIFFSVIFGLGVVSSPENTRILLLKVFSAVSEAMFEVTRIVMRYAPVGVFSLISVTVATFGFSALLPLARLVLLVYGAIVFFALIILGSIARLFHLRIWTIICILKEELALAFSTASSESVLPQIIEKMEAYGASAVITGFVVPTGYSFNLDGSTLYQSIAAIFIAQLYGIELSLGQEIILMMTLMITSKGIAGVPGVSFVVLLATLGSMGIPAKGLAFIAGVDRILDMARTALNVIGNALAVLVIAKWENQYNHSRALEYEKRFFAK